MVTWSHRLLRILTGEIICNISMTRSKRWRGATTTMVYSINGTYTESSTTGNAHLTSGSTIDYTLQRGSFTKFALVWGGSVALRSILGIDFNSNSESKILLGQNRNIQIHVASNDNTSSSGASFSTLAGVERRIDLHFPLHNTIGIPSEPSFDFTSVHVPANIMGLVEATANDYIHFRIWAGYNFKFVAPSGSDLIVVATT